MKISTEKRELTTQGLTEENEVRNFTIKADAAMFKMLSSTLYTHKIRAVIRELTCNAWDAHQAAKRFDIPVDVHMPTYLEPYFEVKDYGKGLSQENVMKLFSTYGESTKQGSNKEIGGFGIGSKSPFCYVDSFIVESRHDGVKTIYNAYIEANGSPSIVVMGSSPMEKEELSGITVKMNCANKDFNEFDREGRYVLRMFNNPYVKWNLGVALPLSVKYQNEFGMSLDTNKEALRGIFARMGNVLYPIPELAYNTFKHPRHGYYDSVFNYMHGKSMIMNFNIGELEVAPSREQLSLTEASKKNITRRLTEFLDAFIAERQKVINGFKKPWECVDSANIFRDIVNIKGIPFKNSELFFKEDNLIEEIRSRLQLIGSKTGKEGLFYEFYPEYEDLIYSGQYGYSTPKGIDAKIQLKAHDKSALRFVETKSRIAWTWHERNAHNFNSGVKKLPIPKILFLTGSKETLDSKALKYQYYLKSQARLGQTVFSVKIPTEDAEFLRKFKRKMLHLPESSYVFLKDVPVPTVEELKECGFNTALSSVQKELGQPRTFFVHELRTRDKVFFTGTLNQVKDPVDLPQYTELKDKEVIYYLNLEEWKDKYVKSATIDENRALEMLANYWDGLTVRPQILSLCKTHTEMIENNPKFVHADSLFQNYVKEMFGKYLRYPQAWAHEVRHKTTYFGREGYTPFKNLRTIGSVDPELARYMDIMDGIRATHPVPYNGDVVKGMELLSIKLGSPLDKTTLDKPQENRQNDEAFLNKFFAIYPMFEIDSDVDMNKFELYADYMKTIKMINPKKRK